MDKQMTGGRHERLREILLDKGLKQKEFAAALGLKDSFLSLALRGGVWLSRDKQQRLQDAFGVNLQWLETGEGAKYLGQEDKATAEPVSAEGGATLPVLHKFGERKMDYGNPNLQILVVTVDASNEEMVRVVPEWALASYSAGFRDVNFVRQLPSETVPNDLRGKGTISKFFVYGESMEPTMRHGDYVYASYVERNMTGQPFPIRNEYVYVINSRTQGLMIKRLFYQRGHDFVQCYSDNPDQKTHAPFSIAWDDILELYYWQATYTRKAQKPKTDFEELVNLKIGLYNVSNEVQSIRTDVNEIRKALGS